MMAYPVKNGAVLLAFMAVYICSIHCTSLKGSMRGKRDDDKPSTWSPVRRAGTRRHGGGGRIKAHGHESHDRSQAEGGFKSSPDSGPQYDVDKNLGILPGDNSDTTAVPTQSPDIMDAIDNEGNHWEFVRVNNQIHKSREDKNDYHDDSGGPNDYNIYHHTQRTFDWGRFVLFLLLCMGGGISVAIAVFFCGKQARKHRQKKRNKLESIRLNEMNESTQLQTAAMFETNPLVPRMYPGQSIGDLYNQHFCHLEGKEATDSDHRHHKELTKYEFVQDNMNSPLIDRVPVHYTYEVPV